jgi:hypothetical protein
MNLDPGSMLLSMLISSVGFVAFVYGKRQERIPQLAAGIVLLVFPYFVSSLLWMALIAVAVLGLMTVAIKLGH